jgi:N-acetylmuramoyl-L-alanine amidase
MRQVNPDPSVPALWDQAQAAYADRSRAMQNELATAFGRSKLPVSAGTTWMRPLDNMQCPAVAVEVSPQKDGTGAEDPSYQGKVADVIAGAMIFWRGKVGAMTPPPPAPKPVAPITAPAAPVQGTPAAKPVNATATPAAARPIVPKPLVTPGSQPAVAKPLVTVPAVAAPKPAAPVRSNP